MTSYSYQIKIPKDRIAVLIGKNGETKSEMESSTGTRIDVDSKEGDVKVSGEDAIKLYSACEVVKAVGRGFNPEIALLLLKSDYAFELIDVKSFAKTKNDEKRLKGRVIGNEGKARKTIEELTETHICVYGKTVAIIGDVSFVPLAKRALESLLSGSPHSNVYRWLERQRRDIKKRSMVMSNDRISA